MTRLADGDPGKPHRCGELLQCLWAKAFEAEKIDRPARQIQQNPGIEQPDRSFEAIRFSGAVRSVPHQHLTIWGG